MIFLVLGITIILSALFPIGELLSVLPYHMLPYLGAVGVMGEVGEMRVIATVVGMVSVVGGFLPAFIAAKIFVAKSQLAARLPSTVPGLTWIKAGVVVLAIFWVVRTLGMGVPGGGAGNVISSFASFIIYPMYICILVGVTKALLSATPNLP